ncbi:MAG: hypothetical protein AUJ85_05855 [Elusimicrobia bacterium CG1_02_37_114]|nr:MAG: hypothetical protein AUJ85_05855 [Elusimicrobia bacterium CG1_02_37_114]PIV52939.1 MAG: hypothetical protein COS17_06585 [Elusimicrobia bacterium CG02_land_8_20_14_3_00_37_13]PIZ14013.1 MAG: hypothetical protein COY53_01795 [Elusimicrobia bacterium CG_4_10_14_0_8_um_filter_37_32]
MTKKCPECKTKMFAGKTSIHFQRNNFYADVENVEAFICPNCGTRSIPGNVAKEVSKTVENLFNTTTKKPVFSGLCFHKVLT